MALNMGIFSHNAPVSVTRFDIFRRALHILSLIQHSDDEVWNTRSLTDVISKISGEEQITEKCITKGIKLLKDMQFPVVTEKGARRIYLSRELSEDEIVETLSYYVNPVIDSLGLRDCFLSYVKINKNKSLWMIARIYFASILKRIIVLNYKSEKKDDYLDYTIHPYKWVYRDNGIYLVAYNESKGMMLFKLNRIKTFKITERLFDEQIPDTEDIFSGSLGAYINDVRYTITLSYPVKERHRIIEDFGRLDLRFQKNDNSDNETVTFVASDLLSVCRIVFGYAGRIKIVSPHEAVAEMKRLIEANLTNF